MPLLLPLLFRFPAVPAVVTEGVEAEEEAEEEDEVERDSGTRAQ